MSKNINKVVPSQKIPKIIIGIAQFLQVFSKSLTIRFAAKLFTTPIRHKMPKRELAMDQNSTQHIMQVPAINKEIVVYEYGKSDKKVLLVHGWSGRGTQLVIKLNIPIDFAKKEFSLSGYIEAYPSMSKSVEMSLRMIINDIKRIKKSGGEFTDIQDHPMVKNHLKDLEKFI